jgi:hypothetical protein
VLAFLSGCKNIELDSRNMNLERRIRERTMFAVNDKHSGKKISMGFLKTSST